MPTVISICDDSMDEMTPESCIGWADPMMAISATVIVPVSPAVATPLEDVVSTEEIVATSVGDKSTMSADESAALMVPASVPDLLTVPNI